jgi:phosphoglucosamine mutase
VANNTSTIPQLFGTDGVRGVADRYPLDATTVERLGAALVRALPHGTEQPRLLVGRDTRESGIRIEAALAHGATGEGATITSAGVVPTPAIAYLTRTHRYDAGVVISASHNPYEDNGIKVFSGSGVKFPESLERHVESIVADPSLTVAPARPELFSNEDLVGAYVEHLRAVFPEARSVQGMKVAIDCANGATTTVAPHLFTSLGLDMVVIGNEPDGRNINLRCGSTHPDKLSAIVNERGCQLGVAFDGDGDRAIFVDHTGRVVDGDAVLLMCGKQLQREGRLKAARDHVAADGGRRQVRDGGDGQARRLARWRAVGPHHLLGLPLHR